MKNIKILIHALFAILCAMLDLFLVVGWFFSIIFLLASAFFSARRCIKNEKNSLVFLYGVASISLVLLLDSPIKKIVDSDINGLYGLDEPSLPTNIDEFLQLKNISSITKARVGWFLRKDGEFIVRLRHFPYSLIDYDLKKNKLTIREWP